MTFKPSSTDNPVERISRPVERVTFYIEESGFCVLMTNFKRHFYQLGEPKPL